MFDFFRTAGRCKKSHRLPAYIVGCLTVAIVIFIITTIGYSIATKFIDNGGYKDFSIHLFGIVTIEGSR